MAQRSVAGAVAVLLPWFDMHARDLPWRKTTDSYAIWISEIMLQQTQVQTVIPYFERWLKRFPDIKALADAPLEEVLKFWAGLGYYRRARSLHAAAGVIMREHGGNFPTRYEAILELPGVGRYTAGAIASIAFNEPAPILDGNVKRVLTRLCGIREPITDRKVEDRLWKLAENLVQTASQVGGRGSGSRSCSDLNQALMELGATICKPQQPACVECPLRKSCVAHAKRLTGKIPRVAKRAQSIARYWAAFVIQRGDEVLIRRREDNVVNGGLWEFPNCETAQAYNPLELARNLSFRLQAAPQKLGRIQHTITRYKNHVDVFHSSEPVDPVKAGLTWVAIAELVSFPFPNAHRRISTWVAGLSSP